MSNLHALIAELPPEKRGQLTYKLRMLNAKSGDSSTAKITRSRRDPDGPPLSFAQQRLWFLDQLEPNSSAYNIPAAVRLSGDLNLVALERTINEIVRRHEVLRMIFVTTEGQPRQVVTEHRPRALEVIDLSRLPQAERESETRARIAAEAQRPFDLSRGPLLRAGLLRLAGDEHVLLLTMHHIVSDGWSAGVLVREMAALYEAYAEGRESPLAELPVQYGDYAQWQREWLQGAVMDEQLSYWRGQLAGAPPLLELPTDRPRPASQSFRGGRAPFALGAELSKELQALSRREGATLFMTLLTAWQILLSRYSGQTDICVGAPIAGRTRAEVEGLIGFFVNMLVIRGDLSGDPPFTGALSRVKEACLGAYAHQDAPFEKLVEEINPERDLSRSPLFQVMMALQNAGREQFQISGVKMKGIEEEVAVTKFDLTLVLTEERECIRGCLDYSRDLYDAETVRWMVSHYGKVLEEIVRDADQRISEIELMSEAEKRQITEEWNKAEGERGETRLVHEMIAEQAWRSPDAVAVVCEGRELSYGELNRRANKLAHYLRRLGVGPEAPVGLCLERSPEMMIGLLGALKAGGAYLPLDADSPAERLAFMLEDSQAQVLLTQRRLVEGLLGRVAPPKAQILCLDESWEQIAVECDRNPGRITSPGNLAYVIYTSGSTGRPKGVLITQRAITQHCLDMQRRYELTADDHVLQFASFNFDASLEQILPTWLSGAKLALRDREILDAAGFAKRIGELGLSVMNLPPAYWRQVVAIRPGEAGAIDPTRLRLIIIGGEKMFAEDLKLWRESIYEGARLLNAYGPTETTITATTFEFDREREEETGEGKIPIGRPLGNRTAYILGEHGKLAPIGVAGELYIGGTCVAQGYLKRPELTAEKFVPHPFSQEPGARLYRTGDLARYLPDGNLEFLGRIDHQVKIRGFRIELGEIEANLVSYPEVREAVVLACEDEGNGKRLVAYYTGEKVEAKALRSHLLSALPEYMVPSAYVQLEELPLTPNGKVDRRALPAPDAIRDKLEGGYVAPRTPLEEVLAEIWREALGLDRVGVEDNFFELGGHSLLATQVISRVRSTCGVELALRNLFEAPQVRAFAARVEMELRARDGGGNVPVAQAPPLKRVTVEGEETMPSFAQQRLWFLDQLEPNSPAYNIPSAVSLSGRLNVAALERTINEMVRRHEALRTIFVMSEGQPRQVVNGHQPRALEVIDLSRLPQAERESETRARIAAEAQKPFDLSRGPLLRAGLLRLAGDEHVLLLTMHHIVSDGWSAGVLVREMAALYEAYAEGRESPLAELPVQYGDYAQWQREWLQGAVLDEQLSYWRRQLAGAPPLLELPTDRPRRLQSYRGAHGTLLLPATLGGALKALSRKEGATLFMTLLASFNLLLSRYSGQTDICVGAPIAGRTRAEIENLIGLFINTLALRTQVAEGETFVELLRRVREVCLGAYAHQDMPFEKLVEELQPERSLSHNPLFQVMFVFQNAPINKATTITGLRPGHKQVEVITSKFDLTLFVWESGEGLEATLEYSADLFNRATARRMLESFRVLLEAVADNPERRVSQLPLLSEAEQRLLLVEWNDTVKDYKSLGCAHEMFEKQVECAPESVAVVHQQQRLTYRELNRRANQLAHRLRALGIGAETRVALLMERSVEMVVALLAALKAGGAYAPLDPGHPLDRLRYMVEDSGAKLILTAKSELRLAERIGGDILLVGAEDGWGAADVEAPDIAIDPEQLAYIIYTSGSTGRPKGVAIPHRALSNYVCWAGGAYISGRGSGSPVVSNLGFDLTVTSIFPALVSGKTVELMAELENLVEALQGSNKYNLVKVTPSHLKLLGCQKCAEGTAALVVGGEELFYEDAREWMERGVRVINEYGPTEATVGSCVYEVAPGDNPRGPVPIGKPIANTQVYVLDRDMTPVPVGVTGELYIGGAGLARGYLHQPALTAERFAPDQFSGRSGARLYRTGDLARWRVEGNLEFLGRADNQVKIRGFRIELGEIEAALIEHACVREAIVSVREDVPGEKRLVAYVAPREGMEVDGAELREHLMERLPDYMAPSAWVMMEELPLTPNGKVDRRALPPPGAIRNKLESARVAPRDALELELSRIWEDILRIHPIGVRENFFELGGHSLLAVSLTERVSHLTKKQIPLATIFRAATIERLANLLREQTPSMPASSLVEIQKGNSHPPLFFIHPSGGNVFRYVDLARLLGPEQPFYGLQAQGLDGEQEVHTQIEEMAAHYLGLIREAQPKGPYQLGGWSLGGLVAFEMAQRLRARNEHVGLVALVDSYVSFAGEEIGGIDRRDLYAQFIQYLDLPLSGFFEVKEEFRQLAEDERLTYVLERIMAADERYMRLGLKRMRHLFRVFEIHTRAARRYAPKNYAGRVAFFKADDAANGHRESTEIWTAVAAGGLDFHLVPGDHHTILQRPNVEVLADQLRAHLHQS